MERTHSGQHLRPGARIWRAASALTVVALAIALAAPVASATSPIAEAELVSMTQSEMEPSSLVEDDMDDRRNEILYQEYNWWNLWSASAGPSAMAPETDGSNTLDDYRSPASSAATGRAIHPTLGEGFFSGVVEPNQGAVRSGDRSDTLDSLKAAPASGNVGIDAGAEGSNTLDDYRSPVGNAATGRAIHPTMGEGYFSGVLEPNQGSARSGGRADALDNLRAAPAPGNDANVTRAEDFQFVEQNVDFGSVNPGLAGPGEGLSDFQFIEQNTLSAKSTWYEAIDEQTDAQGLSPDQGRGLSDYQFIEQNAMSAKSTWYEAAEEQPDAQGLSPDQGRGLSDYQFIEQNTLSAKSTWYEAIDEEPDVQGLSPEQGRGLSDFQFIEQNTLSAKSTWYEAIDEQPDVHGSSAGPGEGLSDFQFIEQNVNFGIAAESDRNLVTVEDRQFIEQNVNFGAAAESDRNLITVEDRQFIEQNTQLPGQGSATGDGPPHSYGQSEFIY